MQYNLRDDQLNLQTLSVLADSAFPVTGTMQGRISTPLIKGELQRAVDRGGDERTITAINNAVTSIRQAA
ncbi:hypothetical protein PsorP6_001437 [Peronosclerospora sorghi]|uniref:Uncharacterized protein n=1 Tax=Peronosclerospora sorghi TaxID=230839 RepID=A0ACC0WSL6_9STRA|nr:hypothetical protein PsorP6_001437 [Peronosclerospora sorghi]